MMDTLTVERLEMLLRDAEAAHGSYEQTLGHHDDEWPRWYAQYILDHISSSARASD